MKKLIKIGLILTLIIVCLSVGYTFALTISTVSTNFGYQIVTEEEISNYSFDECFKIPNNTDQIKDIALNDFNTRYNPENPNNSEKYSGITIGSLRISILPEKDKVCWTVPYERTETKEVIVYTDKSITEDINKLEYDFENGKWGSVTPS